MNIPTTLKHKPVIAVEDYEVIDSHRYPHTDAKCLSLGLAQWNERGRLDISAKVWRHTGGKWSRQSEELPLHRVLDLAILIARACLFFQEESYRHKEGYDPEHPVIDRVGLEGDAMTVTVCTENPMIHEDIELFSQTLAKEGDRLGERFATLARLLKEMGYDGRA